MVLELYGILRFMGNTQTGDNAVEKHLIAKRNELMWALSLQDYSLASIGRIFKMDRSSVLRIVRLKPRDWKPKWVKTQ